MFSNTEYIYIMFSVVGGLWVVFFLTMRKSTISRSNVKLRDDVKFREVILLFIRMKCVKHVLAFFKEKLKREKKMFVHTILYLTILLANYMGKLKLVFD